MWLTDELLTVRLVHNAENVVFPGTPGFDIAGQSVAPLCQSELLGRIVPVEGEEVSIFRCKGGSARNSNTCRE